jgi:FkbM family methyltransferase
MQAKTTIDPNWNIEPNKLTNKTEKNITKDRFISFKTFGLIPRSAKLAKLPKPLLQLLRVIRYAKACIVSFKAFLNAAKIAKKIIVHPANQKIVGVFNSNEYFSYLPKIIKNTPPPTGLSFGVGWTTDFEQTMVKNHNAQVYSYDPTPCVKPYVQYLQKTNRLPLKNFHFFDYAVTDNNGSVKFNFPEGLINGTIDSDKLNKSVTNTSTITVKAININQIIKDNHLSSIDILQMDIEGGEYPILKTLSQVKMKIPQLSLELHPRIVGVEKTYELLKILESLNYVCVDLKSTAQLEGLWVLKEYL